MDPTLWSAVCYFGHFVKDENGWSFKLGADERAGAIAINYDTSYEQLYADLRKICQVDDLVCGFLSPSPVKNLQIPIRVSSNKKIQWLYNFSKQGNCVSLCVTQLREDNLDVQMEENNGFGGGMHLEEDNGVGGGMVPEEDNGVGGGMVPEEDNGVGGGLEPEENNGVGGGLLEPGENNGFGGGGGGDSMQPPEGSNASVRLEVIQEVKSLNDNYLSTPPRMIIKGENNFTNEHVISSVGSTSRVVPIDLDLKVEQVFTSKKELQDAVHMIAMNHNFQFKTKKSNKNVYTIVCVDDNCKWRLQATKFSECDYFQIRKYESEHTCAVTLSTSHRQATSCVIGKHISPKFDDCNTTYRPAHVMKDVDREFGIKLSYQKAWRCRESALTQIRGSHEDSYTKLAAYAHNLKLFNRKSVIHLELDNENCFKYFFMAYGACILGYNSSMRRVIIVDGTFLSARYKGTLIIATCQDANMQTYPLAWAIVDSENDVSWQWFFMKLKEITGDHEGLVVISDRHKSLISAIQVVFQKARHAHGIYHIKGKLRTVTKKAETINLFKRAVEAYTVEEYCKYMSQIEKTNEKAWKYLSATNIETWARSQFKGDRYNIVTSNNAESLNSVFRRARHSPIIPLLENIGKKLQAWFYERHMVAERCTSTLTPAIEEKLQKLIDVAKKFTTVSPVDRSNYVVSSGTIKFIVDFDNLTCTCQKFQLEQVPCEHAIVAVKSRSSSVYQLVSPFYTAEFWRKSYSEAIFPVPNEDGWDIPTSIKEMTILPPLVRAPRAGRHRTKRLLSTGEFPSRQRCSRCQQVGHNRLSCRDQTPISDRQSEF